MPQIGDGLYQVNPEVAKMFMGWRQPFAPARRN